MEVPTTPSPYEPLRQAIVEALQARRWQEALTALESWCEAMPRDASAWLNRGFCLLQLGRASDAVEALRRCLELRPDQPRADQLLARALSAARCEAAPTPSDGDDRRDAEPTDVGSSAVRRPPRWALHGTSLDAGESDWSPGRVVAGRYEIRGQASGGMGTVSFAWDRELERMVAVKTPSGPSLASDSGRARILREAEAWIALGLHPHVCSAYYVQEIGGLPRLFIEYVDGGGLDVHIRRGVDDLFALDVAVQLAAALDHTHRFEWVDRDGQPRRGMVHRDVKPANVLVAHDGAAKLTDFGLVRAAGDPEDGPRPQAWADRFGDDSSEMSGSWETVTLVGGAIGTPPYMASELWRPSRRASAASDVYAFGCVLYEMLCGRRPYVAPPDVLSAPRRDQMRWWMRAHVVDPVPDPAAARPDLDRAIAELVRACLAKEPRDRPDDMADVRARLVEAWERLADRPYPRPEPAATRLRADSRANRGASFATLGATGLAERELREALRVDPRHPQALVNLALLEWRDRGIPDAEVRQRLEHISEDPRRAGVRHHLSGRVLALLDDPDAACRHLWEAARTGATDTVRRDLAVSIARVAVRRGDRTAAEDAAARLAEVIERRPSDMLASAARVMVLRMLDRHQEASAEWARIRKRAPDIPADVDDAVLRIAPELALRRTVLVGEPVACVVSRSDGRLVCRTTSGLALVDPEAREVVRRVRIEESPRRGRTLAALPDGRIVVASAGEPLTVWDLDEGALRARWRAHAGHTVAVAAAGDLVASGATDHKVRLWDPLSGACLAEMAGHGAWVTSLAVVAEGSRVVSSSADGTIRVWSRDGACETVLSGHTGPVHAVVADVLGERVVSGGADGTVRVWDLASGEAVATFGGHSGPVEDVELVDGGLGAASAGPDVVRVWDLERVMSAGQIRAQVRASSVEAIADGRTLAVAAGQEVALIDLDLGEARRLPWALAAPESAVVLASRSAEVATHIEAARRALQEGRAVDAVAPLRAARRVEGFELDDEVLALWSRVVDELPTTGVRTVAELRPLRAEGQVFTGAVFAAPGSGLAVTDTTGGVWRWTGPGGSGPQRMGAHDAPLGAIAGDPDRRWVVTGDRAGHLRVWNLDEGAELARTDLDGPGVTGAYVSPDGSVVVISDDGRVWSWSVDGRVVREIGHHGAPLAAVACSPDGRRVVVGGWDDVAAVWNLERGREVMRLRGHGGALTSVAWTPDGRQIITASTDGTVRVWDVGTGTCRRTIDAHRGEVADVAVGRGGRWIVTGGRDGAVTVWDPRSGRSLVEVATGGRPVGSVDVSAEGDRLAAVFGDGSVRRWYVDHDPGEPEAGGWDDRSLPILESRLTRWETSTGTIDAPADLVDVLESELMRHGFGRPRRSILERQVDRLVETWPDRRRDDADESDRRRADGRRNEQRARVVELASPVTRHLGLKLAIGTLGIVAVLLVLASLRTPSSDTARPNRLLWPLVEARFAERGARFREATWVVSYQDPSEHQLPASAGACPAERRAEDLRMVLHAEELADGPPEEAAPEAFRDSYRRAVQCIARTADDRTVRDVLARLRSGVVRHRQHDLVTVLIGGGERSADRLDDALSSGDVDVRHAAAFALAHLLTSAGRERLVAALVDPRPTRVEAASFVLRELIVSGAVPEGRSFATVRRLSASVDPRVRAHAVRALVLFEREGPAARVLEQALEDSDPDVRKAAEETVASLREAKLQQLFGR